MNSRALWTTAAIAGAAMALLSTIPIISLGNCLLCGWLWGGGLLAVYLYPRFADGPVAPLTAGQGATLGAASGVVGALIATVLGTILSLLLPGMGSSEAIRQAAQQLQATSPEIAVQLEQFAQSGGAGVVGIFLGLIFGLFFYSLFGAIGGAIGSSLFGRRSTAV